jgi:Flp pilus assembly protein TadG
MSGAMKTVSQIWLRARRCAGDMLEDRSAVAAAEFVWIAPVVLLLFFCTVEFSLAVAIDRKVTLMARTLSDLTSQSPPAGIFDADFTNFFAAANGVMTPYIPPLYPAVSATITEIYIDPATGVGRAEWSKGSAPRALNTTVPVPAGLIVTDPVTHAILPGQYLIFSEVGVLFTPTINFANLMPAAGLNLKDVSYTRPRQAACVVYQPVPTGITPPCPT